MALSAAMVMAGSGDVAVLRVLRELRWTKEGAKGEDVSTYGAHLAVSMAIGFLFLAGGQASLRRDPLSIACLLLSTSPRFPRCSIGLIIYIYIKTRFYLYSLIHVLFKIALCWLGIRLGLGLGLGLVFYHINESVLYLRFESFSVPLCQIYSYRVLVIF